MTNAYSLWHVSAAELLPRINPTIYNTSVLVGKHPRSLFDLLTSDVIADVNLNSCHHVPPCSVLESYIKGVTVALALLSWVWLTSPTPICLPWCFYPFIFQDELKLLIIARHFQEPVRLSARHMVTYYTRDIRMVSCQGKCFVRSIRV